MGAKTFFHHVETDRTIEEVKEATQKTLMFLGGTIQQHGDNYQLLQAKNGITGAFAADFDSMVNVRESKKGQYEILVNVSWKPNTLFWICLVVGLFVFGILWVVPAMYLFIDPSSAYQQALFNINNFLPND